MVGGVSPFRSVARIGAARAAAGASRQPTQDTPRLSTRRIRTRAPALPVRPTTAARPRHGLRTRRFRPLRRGRRLRSGWLAPKPTSRRARASPGRCACAASRASDRAPYLQREKAVAVAELALNHAKGDAFASHLYGMGMMERMGSEAPADAGWHPGDHRRPRAPVQVAPAARRPSRVLEPWRSSGSHCCVRPSTQSRERLGRCRQPAEQSGGGSTARRASASGQRGRSLSAAATSSRQAAR